LVIILGIIIVFSLAHPQTLIPANPTASQNKAKPTPPPTAEQQLTLMQKNYPLVVTGVIKFLDTKTAYKTTLKTDAGVEYLLWPAQPSAVYKTFGAKNGGRAQVNGKILGGGKLGWVLMKPL